MKIFIVFPFVFYFLLQINSLSYGQDDRWYCLCLTPEQAWFLDKTTVQCKDGVYIVWVKQIFPDRTYYEVERIQFRANWRKLNIMSSTRYFDNGNINSYPLSPDRWEDILPESMAECLFDYLHNQYPCE